MLEPGSAWPPPAVAQAYAAYADWHAWWSGDREVLDATLAGRGSTAVRLRKTQLAGGVIGRLSRWFWGNPPPSEVRDSRLHLPLPADVIAAVGSLLCTEPITLSSDNSDVQGRCEQLIGDGWQRLVRETVEATAVFGDAYLRPVIDREVWPDRAQLVAAHADSVIPTFRWGQLVDVAFVSTVAGDGRVVRRLVEHHAPGRNSFALFEGTSDTVGRAIPFAEDPSTQWLSGVVDADGVIDTGIDRLDVVRISTPSTQVRWRADPTLRHFGRSLFDGLEPWFDAADEAWTSWMRDLRLAKARLVVPEFMLTSAGAGKGATWDAEREIFTAVGGLDPAAAAITPVQFAIRTAEHKATVDEIVGVVLRRCGISQQTMGASGDVAMTATEVAAKERRSLMTRGDWTTQQLIPGLTAAVRLLLDVESAQLARRAVADSDAPMVAVGDSVQESPETIARTIQMLDAAQAVSQRTKITMLHPDWDTNKIDAEVSAIAGAAPAAVDVAL